MEAGSKAMAANVRREQINALVVRHLLPAVYPFRYYVESGGLSSYGSDLISQYRPAAGYVDRILRGAKGADLPVQAQTKYELVINLKTAKALGLEVPQTTICFLIGIVSVMTRPVPLWQVPTRRFQRRAGGVYDELQLVEISNRFFCAPCVPRWRTIARFSVACVRNTELSQQYRPGT
jgi:hypothetical protein